MTSIGERQKELGFESLNIAFDSGSTKYKRLEPAIREFESFVNGLSVTSTIKDKAREVLAHLKLDDIEEASRQVTEIIIQHQLLLGCYLLFCLSKHWRFD
jgi:hypothetical protein